MYFELSPLNATTISNSSNVSISTNATFILAGYLIHGYVSKDLANAENNPREISNLVLVLSQSKSKGLVINFTVLQTINNC